MLEGMSVDAVAYELVNKRFRNPVISHCRGRLQEHLGSGLDAAIAQLFQKEWESIERSLEVARAKGYGRDLQDNLDRLSVNHLTSLFEKYFDLLVPSESLPTGDGAKLTRSSLMAWLSVIKDVRNPIAHPPESDLAVLDALHLADSSRRVLSLLRLGDAEAGINEVHQYLLRLAAGADVVAPASPGILVHLPPREEIFDEFVGRAREIESLWSWFVDRDSKRWVLVGEGGKGKSAIAYRFAQSVAQASPEELVAVIWVSAKRRRFAEAATLPIERPDFTDLDSALNKLLTVFGDTENLDKTRQAKRDATLALLTEFPSLLIVDDLDSIEAADEDVVEFFTFDAPRTASKILITSRRMYPGLSRTSTRISGLEQPDAKSYFSQTSQKLGLGDRPDLETNFPRIYDLTEGSPLFMEDLLRLCRQLKVSQAIQRWHQNRGDGARRYALEREVELLSDGARQCLQAACWAKAALSVAQLERILGTGEDSVISAIQELEDRFLVPAPEILEGVPSYRAHRNLESLVRQDMSSDPSTQALRDAVSGALRTGAADSDDLDVIRQVNVRLRSSRAREALDIAEHALRKRPSSADLLALRAEVLAAFRPARMTDARQDWSRAVDLGLSRPTAYVAWARGEEDQGDWKRMYDAAALGLKQANGNAELLRLAGYAASRIGQGLLKQLATESARSWIERAERHLRSALVALQRTNATEYQVARVFRALVVNAQFMDSERSHVQTQFWTLRWLEDTDASPEAVDEARRQAKRYTAVRKDLAARGIAL